jgi:hypothetical protein
MVNGIDNHSQDHIMRLTKAERAPAVTGLRSLMNVGPAIEGYLVGLGVGSIRDLAKRDADTLFQRLQRRWGRPVDPCLHDTFRAIIHEAQTGEKTPWHAWTAERKRREAAGELDLRVAGVTPRSRRRRLGRTAARHAGLSATRTRE